MSDDIGLKEYFDEKLDALSEIINGIGARLSADHDETLKNTLRIDFAEKRTADNRKMMMVILTVLLVSSTKDVWSPMILDQPIQTASASTEVLILDNTPDCQKPGCMTQDHSQQMT
jgi:hypothetical protein